MFLLAYASVAALFLTHPTLNIAEFHLFCGISGIVSGYYITQILVTAESFPTRLRATAATAAPNAVRVSLVPLYALFLALKPYGIVTSLAALYGLTLVAGLIGLGLLRETFGRDLATDIDA